jgi:hypothetical protein
MAQFDLPRHGVEGRISWKFGQFGSFEHDEWHDLTLPNGGVG